MRILCMHNLLLLTVLSTTAKGASDIILNQYQYCIRYFGSITADLELASAIPTRNYNGSTICPTSMSLPRVSGATLDICPPTSSLGSPDNPSTLSAELRLSATGGLLTDPIDQLRLQPQLITNGSVSGPFQNNGSPAILALDEIRTARDILSTWSINGTQSSLIELPEADDRTQGVYFGCRYRNSRYYCGNSGDSDAPDGGCWSSQYFLFNQVATALNFTFRFSNAEASVEIWAANEYVLPRREAGTVDGVPTGTNTTAYIVFGGVRQVPSVVDYDFWENSEMVYEIEVDNAKMRQGMRLEVGEDGLPVLKNQTESGEWYSGGNGTYSVQLENAGGRTVGWGWNTLGKSMVGLALLSVVM